MACDGLAYVDKELHISYMHFAPDGGGIRPTVRYKFHVADLEGWIVVQFGECDLEGPLRFDVDSYRRWIE